MIVRMSKASSLELLESGRQQAIERANTRAPSPASPGTLLKSSEEFPTVEKMLEELEKASRNLVLNMMIGLASIVLRKSLTFTIPVFPSSPREHMLVSRDYEVQVGDRSTL